jgi:hypothetical protein
MLRTEIVWICFTITIYQMPDSACALTFVTMVTSPNIFEVFPKERPEMLRLQAESGIWYSFIVKQTHTISVLNTSFILQIKKSVLNVYTRTHDPHIKLCYPGDAASKYRMARVAAPCLLCIEFRGCISESSERKARDVAIETWCCILYPEFLAILAKSHGFKRIS